MGGGIGGWERESRRPTTSQRHPLRRRTQWTDGSAEPLRCSHYSGVFATRAEQQLELVSERPLSQFSVQNVANNQGVTERPLSEFSVQNVANNACQPDGGAL